MKIQLALVLFLFGSSGIALGQTACPSGVAAGSAQCGPSPASHGINPALPAQPQIRYVSTGTWKEKWGAIATDNTSGKLGSAIGMSSQNEAEKAALEDCLAKGGSRSCRVDIAYQNQCAVMVLGSSKYGIGSAATLEQATKVEMEKCNATDTNCRVFYSECSNAEFVRN